MHYATARHPRASPSTSGGTRAEQRAHRGVPRDPGIVGRVAYGRETVPQPEPGQGVPEAERGAIPFALHRVCVCGEPHHRRRGGADAPTERERPKNWLWAPETIALGKVLRRRRRGWSSIECSRLQEGQFPETASGD